MFKSSFLLVIALSVFAPYGAAIAADSKEVKAQRRDAQKQRQQQKNERNKKNNLALREFRQFAQTLKKEYQQKARDLDTEFRLSKVDLNAEHQSKVAAAEAELQQSMMQMMLNPQQEREQQKQVLEKLRADLKTHSDKVYELKKQAAQVLHQAMIENEQQKHRLMSERDSMALDQAKSLGLQDRPKPILATAIGEGLDKTEIRWNDREQKDVEKLYQANQRQLGEFIWGAKLREWEIENKREDFNLEWQKKDELHKLNSENNYYNLFLPQLASGGSQADQKEVAQRMSEISKQNKLINIKYQKINKKNKIRRNEQKREIMGR